MPSFWSGYLGASAVSAASTAYSVLPIELPGPLGMPAFLASWHTTELPLVSAGAQLAASGWALRRGALSHGTGRAGLALCSASIAGLVALHLRGHRSAGVLEAALRKGLGRDHRELIRSPREPDLSAVPARRHLPGAILRVRRRFAHAADIPYGPHGTQNHLDIWRRRDLPADAAAPVLLQIPGGAWISGNKQGQAYPLMGHLADRGWVCVSLNYRLSPGAAWPAQIVDIKRALAWIKANIAEHGGDPGFVAVTGGSAGGHLAALTALSANDPTFQPGFEDADTTVQAAVPFYGIYDWTPPVARQGFEGFLLRFGIMTEPYAQAPEPYEQASPLHRVDSAAPPFFIVHGSRDTLAPVEQARLLEAALQRESPQPTVFAELPGAQHAFDIVHSPRARAAAEAVERFLGWVWGSTRGSGADQAEGSPTDQAHHRS